MVVQLRVNTSLPSQPVVRRMGTVAGTVMMLHLRLQLDRLFQELQLPHLQHLNLLLYNHSPVMEGTDQMVNVVQGTLWRTGHQQSVTQTRNTSAVLSLDFVAALRNIVTVTSVSTTDQSSS